jgi:hypothetical protein
MCNAGLISDDYLTARLVCRRVAAHRGAAADRGRLVVTGDHIGVSPSRDRVTSVLPHDNPENISATVKVNASFGR